jgi:hypothetical protein
MGRAKDNPGCASGLQLTLALLGRVRGDGVCWRYLSKRSRWLVRNSRPWIGLLAVSAGTPAIVPEPGPVTERWS